MSLRRHMESRARKWLRRPFLPLLLLMAVSLASYLRLWRTQVRPVMHARGEATVRKVTLEESTGEMRKSIFYLNIHQTGSTTMTLLLYRFARHYGLNVLPVNRTPHMSRLSEVLMHPPPGVDARQPYQIFAEQYVYRADDVTALMTSDAAHVATIRSPLSQLRALMSELDYDTLLKGPYVDPVRNYLQNPGRWGKYGLPGTKSVQMREFGLDESKLDNRTLVDRHIQYIHSRFELLMVFEYFDESLILAKRRFNWQMEDIIYMGLDAGNVTMETDENVQPVQKQHFEFSQADYILYDHFLGVLLSTVRDELGFSNELSIYRHIKKQVWEFCRAVFSHIRSGSIQSMEEIAESKWRRPLDPRPWGHPFTLHAIECLIMRMNPTVLRNCIKISQYPELCSSPSIQRIHDNSSSILADIRWVSSQSNTLQIHPMYCTEVHPVHKIPLAILTFPGASIDPNG